MRGAALPTLASTKTSRSEPVVAALKRSCTAKRTDTRAEKMTGESSIPSHFQKFSVMSARKRMKSAVHQLIRRRIGIKKPPRASMSLPHIQDTRHLPHRLEKMSLHPEK